MTSILSGARPGRFDLEIVKSPSTSTYTSQTSSPSSTLSESSNSQLAISTRKPRTPRKRPSQTYNEAAALLSTAYPTIFSAKHLTKPHRFTKPLDSFWDPSSEEDLLLPFRVIDHSGFLLHQPPQDRPCFRRPSALYEKPCLSPGEINSPPTASSSYEEDFDTDSILDEEIEEGIIDSIMGMSTGAAGDEADTTSSRRGGQFNPWYGSPLGLGFGDYGFGVRRGVTPLRQMDDSNWWCSPTVDVLQISPRFNKSSPPPADKKKKRSERRSAAAPGMESTKDISIAKAKMSGKPLLLKLNYEGVVNAWSDRGSPFPEELAGSDAPESDVSARLAQIDLFSEGGGLREASMLRYKEKRRTRLFSKKIRYQVRKVNADRRPRMKGRFVRRPNGSTR